MIGIIGAMDEEVAMLKEKLTEVQVETKAAMDFYKGKLEGKEQGVTVRQKLLYNQAQRRVFHEQRKQTH